MDYKRILLIAGIIILASATVYAGRFTFNSILTNSGTQITVKWGQGCYNNAIGGTGPNACASTKPYFCPADSTGGNNYTQNSGTCGCPSGSQPAVDGSCHLCQNPCQPNPCNTLNYKKIYYRHYTSFPAWTLGEDYLLNSTPSPTACAAINACQGTFACEARQTAGYYLKSKELYVIWGSPTEGQSSYPLTNCYISPLRSCSSYINPVVYFPSSNAVTNYNPILTLNSVCANLPSETGYIYQSIECGYGGGHSSSGGGSCSCDPTTTDICCSCNGNNYGCTSTSECGAACA